MKMPLLARLTPGLALCALLCACTSVARADPLASVIDRLWVALSNDPGKAADVQTLRTLFHPQARIHGISMKTGTPQLKIQTVEEFLAQFVDPGADGFYEREVHRSTERYEDLAQVFSTVESRKVRTAPEPDAVGVNSLQLYRENGEWRILTLYYQLEKKTAPIPAHYRSGR